MKLGFDIASYADRTGPVDMVMAKRIGETFVIIKATEGRDYVNPHFSEDASNALKAGLGVAAYHYARFEDPLVEAAHFSKHRAGLPGVLDIETSTNKAWCLAFLHACEPPMMIYGSVDNLVAMDASKWADVYVAYPGYRMGAPFPAGAKIAQFSMSVYGRYASGVVDLDVCDDDFYEAFFHSTPSTGGTSVATEVTGMAKNPFGPGFWVLTRDGGVFSFDGAPFHGSFPALPPSVREGVNADFRSIVATEYGYAIVNTADFNPTTGEGIYRFGQEGEK